MIVGATGHTGHGKTAVIRALTGADAGGHGAAASLRTACLPVEGGSAVEFVDLPGNERFVPTMLAGAAGASFGLLVVDVLEGPKPQTVEHLHILDLLGVRRGAVALSKCDLAVAGRIEEAASEVRSILRDTALSDAEIVPVSALTGEGVEALKRIIREAAAQRAGAARSGGSAECFRLAAECFRLAVERTFLLSGAETVVAGTILAGSVRAGDAVILSPRRIRLRVRGLYVRGEPAAEARRGDRCALNLAGPRFDKDAARRGDWILAPRLHAPLTRFDARLRLLAAERKALRQWTPVRLHLAASHVGARVALLEGSLLEPGGETFAQIIVDQPIGALHGDRFVIRDQSASRTLGGGRVLDPFPPHRERRNPERLARLATENQDDLGEILAARLAIRPHYVDLDRFVLAHNAAGRSLPIAESSNTLVKKGAFAFELASWDKMKREVLEKLEALQNAFPALPGIGVARLAQSLSFRPSAAALTEILKELSGEGAALPEGSWWRLADRTPGAILNSEEAAWAPVAACLEAQRFCPPRVRDLGRDLGVAEEQMRKQMKRLADMGKVIEVAHDHFFLREAVAELAKEAEALGAEAEGGCFKAAAFRDRIGVGRKVAIQILEFFDREGAAIRDGDLRQMQAGAWRLFAAPQRRA